MAKLITQAQFARKQKLSRGRISQLVKAGIIILVNGRVDPAQAEKAIKDKVNRSRQMDLELKPQPEKKSSQTQIDSNDLSLTEVRRNHELLKAELTALQLQIKRGELVPKNEQIKWLVALGSAAKLGFQGLPRRLAPIIRLYDDEKKIEVIIRDEIYKIIRDMEKPLSAAKPRKSKKSDSR